MKDDPQTVQRRCRLCLHSDPTDQPGDVFASPNQELTHQLLRLLELNAGEPPSPVCLSCVQTIQLFDAFGDLCRRTHELFREAEVLPWDQWDGYREHVSALVTLVRARQDDVERFAEARREGVMMEIKEEGEHEVYLEEFDANDALDLIEIKEEKVAVSDFEDALDREDCQTNEQKPAEFFEKRLQVSRALEAQLDLLPADEVSHHKIPWSAVHEQLGWDPDETKQSWESSKRWYKRKLRKGDLTDEDRPLYEIVKSLLNRLNQPTKSRARKRVECKQRFGNERRLELGEKLKLAELVYGQELLWNTKHADYQNQEKRAKTWDEVASNFDISIVSIRKEWRYLREIYRSRQKRVGGPVHECDDPEDTQLFGLLVEMLRDNSQLGAKSGKAAQAQQSKPLEDWSHRVPTGTPFRSEDQRLALAEEIGRHAVIWDAKHPDCGNVVKRGEAWNSVATMFNCTKQILQHEWGRFVKRMDQAASDAESCLQDPLHRRLHQLVTERDTTGVAKSAAAAPVILPRRRYNGKRTYEMEGCIKLTGADGVARYYRVCELCGKEVERSLFEVHMNQHNGLTPYECRFEGCGKRYGNKTTRDRHEIVKHAGESGLKIECQECGERFFYRAKYEYHYAIKHKSDEVPCDICGKRLKHRNLLPRHIKKAHTAGFECPMCGKFLQSKYALDTHMRIHTNEKPFGCELCGERFRIKVLKKRHLANVHNVQLKEIEAANEGR